MKKAERKTSKPFGGGGILELQNLVMKVGYQHHGKKDTSVSGGARVDPVHQIIISASPCAPDNCSVPPIMVEVVDKAESSVTTFSCCHNKTFLGFAP